MVMNSLAISMSIRFISSRYPRYCSRIAEMDTILNFDFILAQQLKNNIQRPLKILQNVGFGMDDALQTVLRFSHSGFLC